MEIGDYVRTEKGEIGKIISYIDDPTDYYCNCYVTTLKGSFTDTYLTEYDNIKSSSNILDLVEPQDLMYIDIDNGYAGGIVVPRVAETMGELEKYIDSFKNKETTLVGIVTHEQLNNRMYKVVE